MENRVLPTTILEFTAEEVDEIRIAVAREIDGFYHTLGFYADGNPTIVQGIEKRIVLLETVYEMLINAHFSIRGENE